MRGKGTFLMLLGTLMILAAGILTYYNMQESQKAGQLSAQAVQQLHMEVGSLESSGSENAPDAADPLGIPEELQPDYIRHPEMEMPTRTVDGQDYVATLVIPALGLDLPVISKWSYPALRIAPCRYMGSAYTGDLIIMAHNYDRHFGKLKNLRPDDLVTVTDMDGYVFTYKVVELEELPGTAVDDMELGIWDLTLFTCTYGGRSRIAVRCDQIEE